MTRYQQNQKFLYMFGEGIEYDELEISNEMIYNICNMKRILNIKNGHLIMLKMLMFIYY